jgi:hypothetical protein
MIATIDHLPDVQLYDMRADLPEVHKLAAGHPDEVRRLLTELERQVAEGRSTPGPGLQK